MCLRNLLTGLAAQPKVLVGIDCKREVELGPFAPRLAATEEVYRKQIRPVIQTGAVVMDGIFGAQEKRS